tara:strand:+ start:2201 stop:2380 length:180 start_codon:yes stop_codon:yes gene_type:complete
MDEILEKEIRAQLKKSFKKNSKKVNYLVKSIKDFEEKGLKESKMFMDDLIDDLLEFEEE